VRGSFKRQIVSKRAGGGVGIGVCVDSGSKGVRVTSVEVNSGALPTFKPPPLQAARPISMTAKANILKCMLNDARLDTELD
jgi:hypothetical protein